MKHVRRVILTMTLDVYPLLIETALANNEMDA